jgi:DNA-binding CsgD family transcriptional regulator
MNNRQPQLDEILELVGSIYKDAVEPRVTSSPLNKLAALLRSRGAQMYTFDRGSGQVVEASSDNNESNESANKLYVEQWGRYDPRPPLSARQASGTVLRCHDHFTEDFVARDPFYQEFFIPNGFRWALGGMLHNRDGTSTVVATVRAPDEAPYERATQQLLTSLLPHFEEASILRRRLAARFAQESDIWKLVEQLPSACFVVDKKCELMLTNPAAGSVLSELPVALVGRYVRFRKSEDDAEWLRIVARIRDPDGVPKSFSVRAESGIAWKLTVLPFRYLAPCNDVTDEGLFFVFAERISGVSAMRIKELAASANLTRAESEVMSLLSRGLSAKSIARERRSTVNTVRTQISAVLSKCGCSSQRELSARFQM